MINPEFSKTGEEIQSKRVVGYCCRKLDGGRLMRFLIQLLN